MVRVEAPGEDDGRSVWVVGTFGTDSTSKRPQGSEEDFAFFWFLLTGLQSGLRKYLRCILKSMGKAE